VEHINKAPGASLPLFDTHARSTCECRIEDITAFYVRFTELGSHTVFTEMLGDVHISFDDKRQRPRAVVWPAGRA
jgi:hypothetical protein